MWRARFVVALVASVLPVSVAAGAPPPPLAMLPSIAVVTVTSHGGTVAVVEDVNLPRGDWKGEALHFHIAFGVPGPRAVDARLVPVEDGALEASPSEAGEALETERVPRRPPYAHALLGRDAMAGLVVHLRPDALTRAFARGNMATLRVRSVADATELDAAGATSVVVRLGVSRNTPLTLGRIVATSGVPAPLGRAEARLCGPDADPEPLAVGILAAGVVTRPAPTYGPTIAPVLAVRHSSDDLCLRLWAKAP
jgi:hypothetical protein